MPFSDTTSATINNTKVPSKKVGHRKMEWALPKPGTGFEETWNE
jgi:hypothetical protein